MSRVTLRLRVSQVWAMSDVVLRGPSGPPGFCLLSKQLAISAMSLDCVS